MELASGQEPTDSEGAAAAAPAESAPKTSTDPAPELIREAAPASPEVSPFPAKSPLDGAPLPAVAATSLSDLAAAVKRARAAQRAWAELPVRDRALRIARVKKKLLARAEEIADLLHRECGKPVE